MAREHTSHTWALVSRGETKLTNDDLPGPTPQFRRKSWLEFQRALDPLAPPKPLPTRQPR